MKRLLSASILAVSLAGCGTAAFSWDAYEHEQCTAMGYQRGTPLYLQCRSMVAQARLARQAAGGRDQHFYCHSPSRSARSLVSSRQLANNESFVRQQPSMISST